MKSTLFLAAALLLLVPRAGAQQGYVQVGEHKAAADGFLAKLKQPGVQTASVNQQQALAADGLALDPTFRCDLVPGLVRIRPDGRRRTAAFSTQDDLLLQAKELMDTGLYEYVEPDWILTTRQLPTDASFVDGSLWGIRNTGAGGGTAGIDVNAAPAWAITAGRTNLVVAVIDTGIRTTHQDLKNNLWVNPGEVPGNGVDDDGNGYVDDVHGMNAINNSGQPADDNGHGTHCAGTIAATANDAGRIVGVAYNVRLMACKFLSASGSGTSSGAVKCLDYATRMGAKISSNSWGGGPASQAMLDAIRAAHRAGSLFVAAAGNESVNNDVTGTYPANYDVPNVVAVAAIDRNGNLASFSNYGRTRVHVGAPGVAVLSSVSSSDSAYATYSGTSMACPHAAGVAALILSHSPSLTPEQVRQRLIATARPLASLNGRTVANGLVNAHAALLAGADGVLDLTLAAAGGAPKAGRTADFTVAVTDGAVITGATVTGNLAGEAPQPFRDDGTAPDSSANDGIYSARLTVPLAAAEVTLSAQASAPGKTAASANRAFAVVPISPNDAFADRIVLAIGSTNTTGQNRNASRETGEPAGTPALAGGQTVWWEWNAGSSGDVTLTTAGSSFDTTLAVYAGLGTLESLSLVAANDDTAGVTSSVTFAALAGGVYYVQVDGSRDAVGDIRLNYPSPGQANGPPFLTRGPASQILVEEDPLELTVLAGGTLPISFQWLRGGVPIPGATGTAYRLASLTLQDAGSYTVRVSNRFGEVTSPAAVVQVDPISVRPANDKWSRSISLVGSSGRTAATNLRASGEAGEPDHANRSLPLESVWFRWTAPSDGTLSVDTYGSSFDTTLGVYTGTSLAALTAVAANDDAGGVQSFVSFPVTAGQTYHLAVDGNGSHEGTILLGHHLQKSGPGLLNDAFGNRTAVGGAAATLTGTNSGAGGEEGEPPHGVDADPVHSVWWSWTAPANGTAVIDTQGSDFDTVLAVYLGDAPGSLVPVAANNDYGGPASLVSFPCVAGTTYAIAVDGAGAAQGAIVLNLVSGATAPEIGVEQPAGTGLTDGAATVDFGTVLDVQPAPRVFTVRNTGAAALTGLRPVLSGPAAADYAVVVPPAAPLAPGGVVTFTVQFTPSAEGTRAAVLQLFSNDGDETPFDIALTGQGRLVPPAQELRVAGLSAQGATLVDVTAAIGDDRGGLAVGEQGWLLNGDTSAARLGVDGTGAAAVGRKLDGLCADLGTGRVYTLAKDGVPWADGTTAAHQLLEVNAATGQVTATAIALTSPVSLADNCGIFSGHGRVVVHSGTRVFDIRLPSGIVVDLGPMARPGWQRSESWAIHGVAEYFGQKLYLGYRAAGAARLDRLPVPSGPAETLATFTNLGDLAHWTVDPARQRWYFSHEGASQFGGTGTANEYAGFAGANVLVLPPPTITSPGELTGYAEQSLAYQIVAAPEVTSYGADGLPAGLVLDPVLGRIEGRVAVPGSYRVKLAATNRAGTTTAVLLVTIRAMPVTLVDDFDPAPEPLVWEQLSGGARANLSGQAGGPGSSGKSLWFGGVGSRHALTQPLDLRAGGKVSFALALANGNGPQWERPDPGEDVVVEYSLDGENFVRIGGPWTQTSWVQREVELPAAAESYGVRIRFRQVAHSGLGLDHWAMDQVRIGASAALVPEIGVEQPAGTPLTDGLSRVTFTAAVPGESSRLVFLLRNFGVADLVLGPVTLTGAHAGDFSVVGAPASPVAPGGSGQLEILFAPGGFGTREAVLQLANNDPNENPFDLTLQGVGRDPLGLDDDFDPSYEAGLWEQFGGKVAANTRGQAAGPGSTGKSLHFDGSGVRHATTRPLDTRAGATVRWLLALGNNAGPAWESPEAGEGVRLEASVGGGEFFPVAGPWNPRSWTTVQVTLPPEARAAQTRLRLRQEDHSGAGLDQWAVDNFNVGSSLP